ncbi:MAG: NusG domain II-containing protein [Lachnospiraceae bacterium]|nr:NusG domain II-containing protein [Lachnospiraceae bacterium]
MELDKDQELEIRTEYGYNKIVISDGKVYVSEADCDNHTCIKQGKIHMTEQSIVCLPHKLIININ